MGYSAKWEDLNDRNIIEQPFIVLNIPVKVDVWFRIYAL